MLSELIEKNIRKYLFLGESGSGKSEIAINLALSLSGLTDRDIHFFDMDQTKASFRARDIKNVLSEAGIFFHSGEQLLDTPIIPHAVESILRDKNSLVIFDVGGNTAGAVNMGQFSSYLNDTETVSYVVLNCFRPFSATDSLITLVIEQIKISASIDKVEILCNPNFGINTEVSDVIEGFDKTCRLLKETGYSISGLVVMDFLFNKHIEKLSKKVIRITPHLKTS